MNKIQNYIRPATAILIGILIGIFFGWFLRPVVIGLALGVAIGIKIAGVIDWEKGVVYGSVIGLVASAITGPRAVIIGTITPFDYITFGIVGIILGAIIGAIACKLLKSRGSQL
jgi:hypothetical protein